MFSKIKNKLDKSSSSFPLADEAVSSKISAKQIYQARYNFGVNFGGCFVREQWLFPSMNPDGAETELDAVAKSAKKDKSEAKSQLEAHWKNYASPDDWKWLKDNGVTAIRVPLGYWNIDGGNYTKGTAFSDYKDIYSNSWKIFVSHFVEPAAANGIAILVDIHALPGGANGDAHSGEKAGGKAEFWSSSSSQKLMALALKFVAKDLKKHDNICGIQVVNEAEFSDLARHQKAYYTSALEAIRLEDKSVPVVISDGWWPNQFAEWIQKSQGDASAGVVVDHHCYRCFSDLDKGKTAEQITSDLNGDLLTNISDNARGVDFMVGEWSCVLDGATWQKTGMDPNDYGNSKRAEMASRFGAEQAKLFAQRAGAGSYFWTFKFESGNGGEWDFRQQLGKSFQAPRVKVPGDDQMSGALDREYNAHKDYWNGQNLKEKYEHERYKDGFTTAWNDGKAFAEKGSLIGRKQAVKLARRLQHVAQKGLLPFLWEWEAGYDKGVEEFAKASG